MPLSVESEFGLGDVVAAMLVGEKAFAALGDPLDRSPGDLGGEAAQDVFGIGRALHAESAADVLGNDSEPRFRQLEDFLGEDSPNCMRRLDRATQRVASRAPIVFGE